jgi:excisionase family DNA binding protein
MFTVHRAAERLGLHPKTVLRCIHDGRLRATRIGKSYRILAPDLDAFSGADKVQPQAMGEARVTAMVEIDSVSMAASERLATLLNAVLMGREPGDSPVSLGTSYEPRAQRLKIMLNGSPGRAAQIIQLIDMHRQHIQGERT